MDDRPVITSSLNQEFTGYFENKCKADPEFTEISLKYLKNWIPNPNKAYYVFSSCIEPTMEFTAELWERDNSVSLYLETGYPFMSDMLSSLDRINQRLHRDYVIPPQGKISHSIRLYNDSFSIKDRDTWDGFCEWAITELKKLIPCAVELHMSFKGDDVQEEQYDSVSESYADPEIKSEVAFRAAKTHSPEEASRLIEELAHKYDFNTVKLTQVARTCARNQYFSQLVKERDNYVCQICGCEGFMRKDGSRYAEAHHIYELSTHLIDDPRIMICVCPTCHRVLHHGSEEAIEERKALKDANPR